MKKRIGRFSGLCLGFLLFGCFLFNPDDSLDTKTERVTGSASLVISAGLPGLDIVRAANLFGGGTPVKVENVHITITGEYINSPITYTLFYIAGSWQGIVGNIPAGKALIKAKGYNKKGDVIYETEVNVIVENNETININLILEPVIPPETFDVKAPVIDFINLSSDKVAPHESVSLEAYAHDPLPGGPLVYSWTPGGPGSFSDRSSSRTTWTAPGAEGFYQLIITVIDQEYLIDYYIITIEVRKKYGAGNIQVVVGTNAYPEIAVLVADPVRIDKGGSTQIIVSAYDPDGDPLSYSYSASVDGYFNNETTMNPVFTAAVDAEYGPCLLTVTVSDGKIVTTGTIQIHIMHEPELNWAPEILPGFQSADSVSLSGSVTFLSRARDPDDEALTFKWKASSGTLGVQTDTLDGFEYHSQIIWTASEYREEPVILSVEISDPRGAVSTCTFLPVHIK